jgi:hypothetical protein
MEMTDPKSTVNAYMAMLRGVDSELLEEACSQCFSRADLEFRPMPGHIVSAAQEIQARRSAAAEAAETKLLIPQDKVYCYRQDPLYNRKFSCGCAACRPELWCRAEGCHRRNLRGSRLSRADIMPEFCRTHNPNMLPPVPPKPDGQGTLKLNAAMKSVAEILEESSRDLPAESEDLLRASLMRINDQG